MKKVFLTLSLFILAFVILLQGTTAKAYNPYQDNPINYLEHDTEIINTLYMGTTAVFTITDINPNLQASTSNIIYYLYDDASISNFSITFYDVNDSSLGTWTQAQTKENALDILSMPTNTSYFDILVYTTETSFTYAFSMTKLAFMTNSKVYSYDYIMNFDYQSIFGDGFDLGLEAAQQTIFNKGYEQGFEEGLLSSENPEFDVRYDMGYEQGLADGQAMTLDDALSIRAILSTTFGGISDLLGITLLPNITIGAIIAVPLVFGLIAFIIGVAKGKKGSN